MKGEQIMESSPKMEAEVWKVCQYRGQTLHDYEVSDLGNVRRATGPHAGRPRKLSLNSTNYPALRLRVDGKKGNQLVHHLVTFTFLGPMPDGMEVDHIDRVPTNNALTNLRYVSRAENVRNRRYKPVARRSFRSYFAGVRITPEQAARIQAILDEK